MLWASLRQEMFIAITNHDGKACVSWDMETLHQLQSSPGDEKWTNRVFLQLISALQYCSGDTKSSAVYDRLVDDLGQWMQSKPTWFTPILFQPPQNGQLFPGIWLLNEFAAVASQYYHLVRIILIAHNPRMPSLGPAKRVAAQRRDVSTNGPEIALKASDESRRNKSRTMSRLSVPSRYRVHLSILCICKAQTP